MKLEATLSPEQAAARRWDVAIVGSGPAGAFAARELARRGSSRIVDRQGLFSALESVRCVHQWEGIVDFAAIRP